VRIQSFRMAIIVHLVFAVSTASAFNINLVYPGGNLFSATHDTTAKAAINAAAADVSAAITTNLAAIISDSYTGNSGGTSVTFNWNYRYTNPSTGGATTIEIATIPTNTVTLYVGSRNLPGSTLGEGGPAGFGYQVSASYNGTGAFNLQSATSNAASQSQNALKRGGGPVLGTHSDTIDLGPQSANFSIDFGLAYGSLALDWSGSGDGNWHFNHTTTVAAGKNDLYSVALHEILHAVGIGSSASWTSKVSGTNWTGSNVVSLMGSGTGLINAAGDHIASGTMSTRASDGIAQEAVMDPSLTQGTRKYLTALDLSFLRDIGYNTVDWVIPSSTGDFDNDGDVDGRDFLLWQRGASPSPLSAADLTNWRANYGGGSFIATSTAAEFIFAGASPVPEPSPFILVAMCGVTLLGRRSGTR
jgi:hypothetical protein